MPVHPVATTTKHHEGDLVLDNNNVTIIENCLFTIHGMLVVTNNATLIVRNATIKILHDVDTKEFYTIHLYDGTPRIYLYNSTITSNYEEKGTINLFNNSTATVHNSTIEELNSFGDSSSVTIYDSVANTVHIRKNSTGTFYNSGIGRLQASDSSTSQIFNSTINWAEIRKKPTIEFENSTIHELTFEGESIDCQISELVPGKLDCWNFYDDCHVTIHEEGGAPNVSIEESMINKWELWLWGQSNATILKSKIGNFFVHDNSTAMFRNSTIQWIQSSHTTTIIVYNSTLEDLAAIDNSIVMIYNSTVDEPRAYYDSRIYLFDTNYEIFTAGHNGRVFVHWSLIVKTFDASQQPIKDVRVLVKFSENNTILEETKTNKNGVAKSTLLSYIFGYGLSISIKYTTVVEHQDIIQQKNVTLSEPKTLTFIFGEMKVPDFQVETTPATQTVYQGDVAQYTVILTSIDSFSSTVFFTISGLPEGITYSFDPESITPPADSYAESYLSVTVSPGTEPRTYTITITAAGNGIEKSQTIRLTVEKLELPSSTPPDLSWVIVVMVAIVAIIVVVIVARYIKGKD